MGLPAGTFTSGAGIPAPAYRDVFQDKEVIICYDCDEAGRVGATRIAEWLHGIARIRRIADLQLPYRGGDLTDFLLKERRSIAELRRILTSARVQTQFSWAAAAAQVQELVSTMVRGPNGRAGEFSA